MDVFVFVFRQLFMCSQRCARLCGFKYVKKEIPSSKLPWFWIGAKTEDNDIETVTEIVNRCIKYGNKIDVEFLEEITGIKDATWTYIDSETLDEKNFPSDGFLIES